MVAMSPIEPYAERINDSKDPTLFRTKILERLRINNGNVTKTALELRTTPKTIRKWRDRVQRFGDTGLRNRSRKPHHSPNSTPGYIKKMVIQIRNPNPKLKTTIGQDRIQTMLEEKAGIHLSTATIHKILAFAGLIKPRKKKIQKKREITEYRKQAKALRLWQVDPKDLSDIPNIFFPVYQKRLPRYQYGARDVKTAATFFAYAYERSITNSMRFGALLLSHLSKYGIPLEEITIQTDNGAEFIGSIYAWADSGFSVMIEKGYGAKHNTIPVATPRFNGCIESFNGLVESEFYDVEELTEERNLLNKAYTYSLYFNLDRIGSKNKTTPWERVVANTDIRDPTIMDFCPVILDELPLYDCSLTSGYDVCDEFKNLDLTYLSNHHNWYG